ncbi:DUF4232 domain-containing protein [Crossiella sp. SN42]|uniref:DUF4232 domain-containing protein n=1 Tax=Crossiella sp. SN42 TaxID=2944808 RepID=UPI00207D28ED|nr:DUF4232 domain-containing protein [Crossiella sp. SN42]MCO1578316.1 DUF4232 domain-containing protein [Crossiella sp. SN42]
MTVRFRPLLALSALALLTAACGQPTAQSPGSGTPSGLSTAASTEPTSPETSPAAKEQPPEVTAEAQVGRCTAEHLRGELKPGDSGAGQRYATLVVTNTGKTNCTLYGYGGLALLDGSGNALRTKLERKANPGPKLVTLRPGGKAGKDLHWGAVPGEGEPATGQCQPSPAKISVIPPDERTPFELTWSLGPVCQQGKIEGSAYHPL